MLFTSKDEEVRKTIEGVYDVHHRKIPGVQAYDTDTEEVTLLVFFKDENTESDLRTVVLGSNDESYSDTGFVEFKGVVRGSYLKFVDGTILSKTRNRDGSIKDEYAQLKKKYNGWNPQI